MSTFLMVLLASFASAQGLPSMQPFREVVGEMRKTASDILEKKRQACKPALPGDDQSTEDCDCAARFECGPTLGGKGEPIVSGRRQSDLSPVNSGFLALGPAGKTGSIDGPGRQGNGKYRVDMNEPYELQLTLNTGYIRAQLTLKRDPATGKDTMRFKGKTWGDGEWNPEIDSTSDAALSYDAGKDTGAIRWLEQGKWKQEKYWNGKAGRTSMTIEFGGGYDHDFKQD